MRYVRESAGSWLLLGLLIGVPAFAWHLDSKARGSNCGFKDYGGGTYSIGAPCSERTFGSLLKDLKVQNPGLIIDSMTDHGGRTFISTHIDRK